MNVFKKIFIEKLRKLAVNVKLVELASVPDRALAMFFNLSTKFTAYNDSLRNSKFNSLIARFSLEDLERWRHL